MHRQTKGRIILIQHSDLPDTSYIFFSANRITSSKRKNHLRIFTLP